MRRVTDAEISALLTDVQARYAGQPSDYLEGVLTGLSQVLDREPPIAMFRDEEQAKYAAGISGVERTRDFYLGMTATLSWVLGEGETPVAPR